MQLSTFATLSAQCRPAEGKLRCPLLGVMRTSQVLRFHRVMTIDETTATASRRGTTIDRSENSRSQASSWARSPDAQGRPMVRVCPVVGQRHARLSNAPANAPERDEWSQSGRLQPLRSFLCKAPATKSGTERRAVPPQSFSLTSLPNSRWSQGSQIGTTALSNCVKYSSARRLGAPNWLDQPRGFCNSPHMLCIVQL